MTIDRTDARVKFAEAMQDAGLSDAWSVIADGHIHRCKVRGKEHKTGRRDGAYVLHLHADYACGGFQNWTNGQGWRDWSYKRPGWKPSPAQQREIERAIEQARSEHEKDKAQRQAEARAKADDLWHDAPDASASHPYCCRKQVEPEGLRMFKNGPLLVPLCDERGRLVNLQFIPAEAGARKNFLTGGRVRGCHFWVSPRPDEKDRPIYICEGWATAETVFQATRGKCPVLVAFDAYNLKAVAEWLREQYPKAEIILCADDDWKTEGNPGLKYAHEAARAVNGKVALPVFGEQREDGWTDFNDMLVAAESRDQGLDAVKAAIDAAVDPDEIEAADAAAGTDDPEKQKREDRINELVALKLADPLAYEAERVAAARELKLRRLSVLDHVVDNRVEAIKLEAAQQAGADNLYEHWTVEPWDEPVDTGELLRSITELIARYVATLGDRVIAVALWIMFSWVHAVARHSPILLATSAEANCGKTTLLAVIASLARRALASVSISGPALFRSLVKWEPTIVVDEADSAFVNNDDLRAVVNSGWTRGQGVVRCDPETNEPQLYSTFAAKALGMKGKKLPDTTLSRCLVIELKRKQAHEQVEDFPHGEDTEELHTLRRKLLRWSTDHAETLRSATPDMVAGFDNRVRMNWLPLFAIAELAGAEAKQQAHAAATAIESGRLDQASLGVRLLTDIREIFDNRTPLERANFPDGILSRDLVAKLIANEEAPWAEIRRGKPLTQNRLADLLGQFAIISEEVHPSQQGRDLGEKHGKGYQPGRFEEAFARYLPAKTPSQPGHPPSEPRNRASADETGTSGTSEAREKKRFARFENAQKPLSHAGLRGCAVRNADSGGSERESRPQDGQALFPDQPSATSEAERYRLNRSTSTRALADDDGAAQRAPRNDARPMAPGRPPLRPSARPHRDDPDMTDRRR